MPIVITRCKHFFDYFQKMKKDREREAIITRLIAALKQCRLERGLSQNETAWRAGLSQPMVLRVERRERLPTIETLLRIADALETDLAALLSEAVSEVRRQ